MGHGCRICQSVAVGTAVGVAVGSGSSHPAVVNVRKANSPPNHTEGRPTNFCVNSHPSRTATPSRRHPQGVHSRPDYLDHPYQVGSTIHTILSFDPGAPPNCFGRRLRSSSVRQPPFLAQIDPRQPQLIIGTLCAQELPANIYPITLGCVFAPPEAGGKPGSGRCRETSRLLPGRHPGTAWPPKPRLCPQGRNWRLHAISSCSSGQAATSATRGLRRSRRP